MNKKIGDFDVDKVLLEKDNRLLYEVTQNEDQHSYFLKSLRAEYPSNEELASIQKDYEILQNIDSKYVLNPLELRKNGNSYFIVFEKFDGVSLKEFIKAEKLSFKDFLKIALNLTGTLNDLHKNQIILKELTPEMLYINPSTLNIKILDIGDPLIKIEDYFSKLKMNVRLLNYISPELTGRMNRTIDSRSNIYTLGIVLYEILTHTLPFHHLDPMVLIHRHLTQPPIPPHEIENEIPKQFSDIILKCLAKIPEDRYQSIIGLESDLNICLAQLQNHGTIDSSFVPGKLDIREVFRIPDKTYGRQQELSLVGKIYKAIAEEPQLLLVTGEKGVGKGAFVQEIAKSLSAPGICIIGKYEASQQHIPFSGLIQAFTRLIQDLLKEKEEQLEESRKKLILALQNNGQLLIDVIPELEFIIGKQPPVSKLGLEESRSRFSRLLTQFIFVFANEQHPLTLILEDLQLADAASLSFIKDILTNKLVNHLFIVETYTATDNDDLQIIKNLRQDLEKESISIHEIELLPLTVVDISQMLADTLQTTLERTSSFAELLYNKTKGNPFFLKLLLKKLQEEQFIKFNLEKKEWDWEIDQLQGLELSKNVVDLMLDKIKQFDIKNQEILSLAGAIGPKFSVNLLSKISKTSSKEVLNLLQPAFTTELIQPVQAYVNIQELLTQEESQINDFVTYNEGLPLKFVNNRIHSASDSLSPQEEKLKQHYDIGRYLLSEYEKQENQENYDLFFEILGHLNLARHLITNPQERIKLAELNLKGCHIANNSTAYALGLDLITIARELLPPKAWKDHYNLTYSIFLESTSSSFYLKKFEDVETLSREILDYARTNLDKGKLYAIKMAYYINASQYDRVIDIGIACAALFGLKIPKEPSVLQILWRVIKVKFMLGRHAIEKLAQLPLATNEEAVFLQRLMEVFTISAFFTSKHLLAYATLRGMELILKDGYSEVAASLYSLYGGVLESLFKDYQFADELARLSIKIAEEGGNHSICSKSYFAMVTFLGHWTHPFPEMGQYLEKCYSHGMDSGELFSLSYITVFFGFADGTYLQDLKKAHNRLQMYSSVLYAAKNIQAIQSYTLRANLLVSLMNPLFGGSDMTSETFDEEEFHQKIKNNTQFKQVHQGYIAYKSMLYNLFGYYQEGLDLYYEGASTRDAVAQLMTQKDQYFYHSLNMIGTYSQLSYWQWFKYKWKINSNQKMFKKWIKHCPSSNSHRYELVEAELARIEGYMEIAMHHYDQAIKLANENNFVGEAGLANELAAKYYLNLGKLPLAKNYMREAYYCYYRWGALSKTAQLEKLYPNLIESKINLLPSDRLLAFKGEQQNSFDLSAVMRASSVLSKEINLDRLLNEVLRLLIVEAGADRAIFLMEKEGKWVIQGEKKSSQEEPRVLQELPFEDHAELLSIPIINFVLRTREKVIINDTSALGIFSRDHYLLENHIKAVLCIPIVSQGKLSAILYLENRASKDVFSQEKIRVLEMLSAQIASSVENSTLYGKLERYNRNLENKVLERTNEIQTKNKELADALEELKNTQHHLIESGKLAALGQLIAGIAHEINTPLGAVRASSQNASEAIKTVLPAIPVIVNQLTPENLEVFLHVIKLASDKQQAYSSKEERQAKKVMVASFEKKKFSQAYELVDLLIDMGIYEDLSEKLKPIEKDALGLLSFAYNLSAILKNNQNIQLAVERASKIIFALKAYIHQDSAETLVNSNLVEGLESVLTLYYHQLKHNIEVKKQYHEIPLIPCRPNEINQVWTNLIHNALQAMNHQGTIEIEVFSEDNWVVVHIIDSGKGIPEDVKARIFTPFFTTKARGEGSGLGLSISKKIIEAHGGSISFESVPGRTMFSIKLPMMISQEKSVLASSNTGGVN